jgi:hypothetical protein
MRRGIGAIGAVVYHLRDRGAVARRSAPPVDDGDQERLSQHGNVTMSPVLVWNCLHYPRPKHRISVRRCGRRSRTADPQQKGPPLRWRKSGDLARHAARGRTGLVIQSRRAGWVRTVCSRAALSADSADHVNSAPPRLPCLSFAVKQDASRFTARRNSERDVASSIPLGRDREARSGGRDFSSSSGSKGGAGVRIVRSRVQPTPAHFTISTTSSSAATRVVAFSSRALLSTSETQSSSAMAQARRTPSPGGASC